jgi:uncharacterized protein DUF4365
VEYPKRTSQHIQESRSFKALSAGLPDEWILRHVTERDYGLDCIVEIPLGEQVVGWLFGAQVKSTTKMKWREDGTAILAGIKCSTANYWLGLPFPVILFLYDEAENKMFIANARQQCRRRFDDLLYQSTTSFSFKQRIHLGDEVATDLIVLIMFQEQSFETFASALKNLLVSVETHLEFIERHWERDFFLEVPVEALIFFTAFCDSLGAVADFVALEKIFGRSVPRIDKLIEQDQSDFHHSSPLLHEATLARALRVLARDYVEILQLARKRVAEEEFSFWLSRDPLLANYCTNSESEEAIDTARKRIASL